MTWRLARSLEALRSEVNRHAPKRSTASDGTIGDATHSARVSDHNPNPQGVVRAMDLTHDPAGGLDCNDLAERLARLLRSNHPAMATGAYIIWNRRIISRDRLREGWRPYTGSNGHTKHLHLSVATAAKGYDSTVPWSLWPKPKRPKRIRRYLAETKTEIQRIKQARASAKVRGESPEPYTAVLKKLRASRRKAKRIAR